MESRTGNDLYFLDLNRRGLDIDPPWLCLCELRTALRVRGAHTLLM